MGTNLDRTPLSGQYFIDGMSIGTSVDAITGEFPESAIDASTIQIEEVTPPDEGDHFSFTSIENIREIEIKNAIGYSSSITFPVDGLEVSSKQGIDFTENDESEGTSILYVLNWERVGPTKKLKDGSAKLKEDAQKLIQHSPGLFRDHYGDYFVERISTRAKFTAVWKCTATSSKSLTQFKASLNVTVKGPGDIGGSAGFSAALSKSLSENNVSVNVQYDTVGASPETEFDTSDISKALESFRKNCRNVPSIVYLHHYDVLDRNVPATVDMDPTTFNRLCNVFSKAQFVLFLNGLAPGSRDVRLNRRENLINIFRSLHASRVNYEKDEHALKTTLDELDRLKDSLLDRLARQDLIFQVRSLTFEEICNLFRQGTINEQGSWIKASDGMSTYSFGRTYFSGDEIKKYGVKTGTAQVVHLGSSLFHTHDSAMNFPGDLKVHATAVGITVNDHWGDGTTGYWCIPHNNPLGTDAFKIEIESLASRGMHWSLEVTYIDHDDYDG
ncbi:hypothetical protein GYMLUDRAFT_86282 [Collybiopsis luxurians FD-317 M1]|uniref:MACPF domain-containing protein n=1 Tax=Collybiopsis luxurians FD-317 M1 TaxID=944289 RepID=A0A0D0CRZ9_9AGAR|nr:hypothetical protein GYMLUDRAFT_86282 [Collybiopsis luxurians FD-317 M1]